MLAILTPNLSAMSLERWEHPENGTAAIANDEVSLTLGKDAYDIYYCCVHHPGGIDGLASELQEILENPVVNESLHNIRDKFAALDSVGPVWAASVVRDDGEDFDFAKRAAFERVQRLLGQLGITS